MAIPLGMLGLAGIGAAWYFSKSEERKREACLDDGMNPDVRAVILLALEDKWLDGRAMSPDEQYAMAAGLIQRAEQPKAAQCLAQRAVDRGYQVHARTR